MKSKQGFSLLEVLVAGFLFSIVLLGVYTILLKQRGNLAYLHQQLLASIQLNNLFEQLRLNKNNRDQEKKIWQEETSRLLPSTAIPTTSCYDFYCKACIFWKNPSQKPLCFSALVPALPYWN